jgi:hypothetical protein
MSMSDTTEIAALAAFLQGTDPAYRAGATQYLALFEGDPGESASLAQESNYTSYARVALTKATAWTGAGNPFTNADLIQFPACTGSTSAITHFAVVDTGPARSTAVNMMISGALSATLNVSSGIQPQFAIGALSVTAT